MKEKERKELPVFVYFCPADSTTTTTTTTTKANRNELKESEALK